MPSSGSVFEIRTLSGPLYALKGAMTSYNEYILHFTKLGLFLPLKHLGDLLLPDKNFFDVDQPKHKTYQTHYLTRTSPSTPRNTTSEFALENRIIA
jgi:hypothetical protein